MANKPNGDSADTPDPNARLVTDPTDRTKGGKWFDRARELGEKRQFDYAIEYLVNGLEFWPDAVEEACKPLHGCAVARRQTGGKKPGLKDTMRRSVNDKNAKKAYINSLWLFGRDPDNLGYIEGIARNASKLRAEDAAKWAAGVLHRALDSNPKAGSKQFQALVTLLEELGDRAKERGEASFGVEAYQAGVEALTLWRRRVPRDASVEVAIKNMSTKLTILKGKYEKGESYRESICDSEEQRDLHDQQRSIQSDDRVAELVSKAEAAFNANPGSAEALKHVVELLCRREREDEETRAIGILLTEYKRGDNYRWKHLADDIRMKQLGRRTRELVSQSDPAALKEQRISQLRFELGVFKDRVERYPTDHGVRFEYGVRNFLAGRFDEAIPMFQGARVHPKNRSACGLYLGRCFFRKGYHDQAIHALEESFKEHPHKDDDLAKTLLYWLARAQEATGAADDARKTYGRILQMDYTYSDVRARLDALPQG